MWFGASDLTCLRLSFLIPTVEILRILTSEGCGRDRGPGTCLQHLAVRPSQYMLSAVINSYQTWVSCPERFSYDTALRMLCKSPKPGTALYSQVALSQALREEETLNFRAHVYRYWRKRVLGKENASAVSYGKNLVKNLEFSPPQGLLFQGLSELVMAISRVENQN